MTKPLALLLVLAGCAPSLRSDLGEIRAQRIEMEETVTLAEDAPLWSPSFEKYITDEDAFVPGFLYDHLLGKLCRLKKSEIRSRTEEGFDPDEPEKNRGRFFRISGGIARIWPEAIPGSRSPLTRVFAGILYTEAGFPVLFHLAEKPEVLELGEDFVELDGLFLKTMIFRGAGGKTLVAPFFLAKTLRKLM